MKVIANSGSAVIKAWVDGVPVEDGVWDQVNRLASMPFVRGIALMPDCHIGKGSTVGTVFATERAVIPAAVGVDIGCGMVAVRLSIKASQLPDDLSFLRACIESAVPHGRTVDEKGRYNVANDRGSWSNIPSNVGKVWNESLKDGFDSIVAKYPRLAGTNNLVQLGTLGGGNHFIELCIEKDTDDVWLMLHSGSRGVGNSIGTTFIELAQKDMQKYFVNLPDRDLAYLPEGTEYYNDYVKAVSWAQKFAFANRQLMLENVLFALKNSQLLPEFQSNLEVINCHHNYVSHEKVHGKSMLVTRKGAIDAHKDVMGIIPGSMGARSFIVRGKGNYESLNSSSHGAGRVMSRGKAKELISLEDHARDTEGVECRKDATVIDESPKAYKDIVDVMNAQVDNVEIVHEIKQVLCVKG